MATPLAERMRPTTFEGYVGQQHLVGPNGIIRRMVESGHLSPFILWGPPGVGKTTLAHIVSLASGRAFYTLSAVHAGVKDVRDTLNTARQAQFMGSPAPILFIDEIHRFNKSQQDSLLGAVEKGEVVLIGATTENPSFEVISPLLSRCQVYTLNPLSLAELETLVQRAITQDGELKKLTFDFQETAALYGYAGGDGRRLLNILDLLQSAAENGRVTVTNALVEQLLQTNSARYDKGGDMHYDCISAFIKSVRGSDPNGAIYWLARMLEGGEDPVFIARRLAILAAEDIGLANPNGLLLAQAGMEMVKSIGMPEARIPLAEVTIYLANSAKSNSAYMAINAALEQVRHDTPREVPLHLRNASTGLMKQLGYAEGYRYAHDYPRHFVEQEFLPAGLEGSQFYTPADNAREQEAARTIRERWGTKYGGETGA